MEFRIRQATVGDAEAIGRVHVESWRSTYPGIVPAAFLAALDVDARIAAWNEQLRAEDVPTFIAEDLSGVFGFVCGGKIREPVEGFDAELYAIYLLADHQGHGAGRRLGGALAARLRAEGCRAMLVWVLEQNHGAVNFYKRLGGVEITRKTINIGGVELRELAFGWRVLHSFALSE